MKTKKSLIMIMMITIVILLSIPAIPALAEEKPFKGLVPMIADGLWAAGTNLPTGVEAVLPQNALKTLGGGVQYVRVGTDFVFETADMMINGFGRGTWIAATNLPVAAVAAVTRPHEVIAGGAEIICRSADSILKYVFGP